MAMPAAAGGAGPHDVVSWTVGAEEDGTRLDRAVPFHVPSATRTQAKRWIEDGRVTVERRAVRPSRVLHAGERVKPDAAAVARARRWRRARRA